MKVLVPVAAYGTGTTGEYVYRAFKQLGHDTTLGNQYDMYGALLNNTFDLIFCVDSGGPFNFFDATIQNCTFEKLAFWLIDYRHGKYLKNPNDFDTAKYISDRGGHIFQAQIEDSRHALDNGIFNCSWLPLAADPEVWNNEPTEDRIYDISFVGNIWDHARHTALESLKSAGLCVGFAGPGGAQMEAGAKILRQSKIGFNISSFFGDDIAYDVNMRFFETLSCGIPLITNEITGIDTVLNRDVNKFVRTYRSLAECVDVVLQSIHDEQFLATGVLARDYIINNATYIHRVKDALLTLGK